jgi:hypothetical protein
MRIRWLRSSSARLVSRLTKHFRGAASWNVVGEWTLILGQHAHRRTGYEPTREDAMAAFAKSWRRE